MGQMSAAISAVWQSRLTCHDLASGRREDFAYIAVRLRPVLGRDLASLYTRRHFEANLISPGP
jgi:hypothetical protein